MNAWLIFCGEIVRILRSRTTFVLYLATPLLLIFILGSALSSQFFGSGAGSEAFSPRIAAHVSGPEDVRDRLQESLQLGKEAWFERADDVEAAVASGKADFGVVVQEKAASDGDTNIEWQLYPGSTRAMNIVLESVIRGAAEGSSVPETRALNGAVKSETLQPFSAMQYYASAMLVMFLLYSGMMASVSLIGEKERNTLERLGTTPVSFGSILTGKMVAHGSVALLQSLIIIAFTHWVYGVNWGDRLGALVLAAGCTVAASMSLALLVACWLKSVKIVSAVFQTLVIIMTFLSGGFSPSVGEGVNALGRWTLSYWSTRSFLRLMIDSPPPVIVQHLAWLAVYAAALFALSILSSRRANFL